MSTIGRLTKVIRTFVRTVFRWQRRQARALGYPEVHTGSVTFAQRFGSLLQLNPHAHTWIPDGVFVEQDDGELSFVALPRPTDDDIETLCRRLAQRITKLCVGDDDEQLPPVACGQPSPVARRPRRPRQRQHRPVRARRFPPAGRCQQGCANSSAPPGAQGVGRGTTRRAQTERDHQTSAKQRDRLGRSSPVRHGPLTGVHGASSPLVRDDALARCFDIAVWVLAAPMVRINPRTVFRATNRCGQTFTVAASLAVAS